MGWYKIYYNVYKRGKLVNQLETALLAESFADARLRFTIMYPHAHITQVIALQEFTR